MEQDVLKKLHEHELLILKNFHEYCKKHNLTYYLIGGALLGAKRYGGFIPWDDDIDVAMFREDYNKLQALWEKEPIDGCFLQSGKTDPKFARGILKIRMNDTKALEYTSRNIDIHHGIYIDIFPIDYTSNKYNIRMEIVGGLIKRLLSLRSIKSGYSGTKYCSIKSVIKHLLPLSAKQIDLLIEKLSTAENDKEREFAVLWVHNYGWKKQLHKTSVFGNSCECKFENFVFSAPCDTHSFLSQVFGEDYLQEPPDDKKKLPHSYIEIEFKG
ncbi:MAG: LicD family protein [Clostridiales bacterium]|jgi:lipopolysaccharide cholinephosphotransferase|nr:LicD family protein [Clostridiales bacterium]